MRRAFWHGASFSTDWNGLANGKLLSQSSFQQAAEPSVRKVWRSFDIPWFGQLSGQNRLSASGNAILRPSVWASNLGRNINAFDVVVAIVDET